MFGLDTGGVYFTLILLICFILPFFINLSLAKSRGQKVGLILILTLLLSWIVTVILWFMPKIDAGQQQ